MAEKRMFSRLIVENDKFKEMPLSSQCLYFHLGLEGDDDGFVGNPKSIMRSIGCNEDDMRVLITKGFVMAFDSGVIVITHWNIHNNIRKDRKKNTIYVAERSRITESKERIYRLTDTCLSNDGQMSGRCQADVRQLPVKCPHSIDEYSIGEYRLDKVSVGEVENTGHAHTLYGTYNNVILNDLEYQELKELMGEHLPYMLDRFSTYMKTKGISYKDHKATLESWYREDKKKLTQEDNSEYRQKYGNFSPPPTNTDYESEYDFTKKL